MVIRIFILLLLVLVYAIFFVSCKTTRDFQSQYHTGALSDLEYILETLEKLGHFVIDDNDYDLNGGELIVKGKIIFKGGGRIINGVVRGRLGEIEAGNRTCFENIVIAGDWTNEEINLKWLTENNNALNNFLAMTNIIGLGKRVLLTELFEIATQGTKSYYSSSDDIIIRGSNRDSCGLIMITKHAKQHSYFRVGQGININLENITITTIDEIENRSPIHEYRFAICWLGIISPDLVEFKMESCTVSGNVQFLYGGSPNNVHGDDYFKVGLQNVLVERCKFVNVVQVLTISNIIYDSIRILDNALSNIYGPVFFLPISGLPEGFDSERVYHDRKYMLIRGNSVVNENPVYGVHYYMSLVVAKGNYFEVTNNTIENILNLRASETYSFYCSASNYLLVRDNKILNCGTINSGKGGRSSLCKLKGSENADILDNEFIFDHQGLVDLGLLSSVHDDPATIDSSKFQFSIFDGWSPGLDSVSVMRVERNIFKTAVLSDVSHIFNAQFYLKDNTFEIGHVRTTDKKNYGSAGRRFNHTVFNYRSPLRNAVMEIERNRVSVGSMDSTILFFTYNVNDDKEYERVVYRDNTFKVNGIVSLDYPRTKTLISENIFEGNGSMTFTQAATAKKNRTIGELRSVQKIDRYTDNPNGILFLKNFGSAAIKVEKNTAETANLVRVTFNDLYHYNDQDQLPILLTIKVKTRPALGREQNYLYRIVFKDYRSMYFADPVSGELKRNTPYWSSGNPPFSYDIAPITSGTDEIRLSLISHSAWGSRHREGYIMLQNLGEVESFEVEASIQKYEYPSGLSENEAIRSTVTGDG
jgi:hypothetical protein